MITLFRFLFTYIDGFRIANILYLLLYVWFLTMNWSCYRTQVTALLPVSFIFPCLSERHPWIITVRVYYLLIDVMGYREFSCFSCSRMAHIFSVIMIFFQKFTLIVFFTLYFFSCDRYIAFPMPNISFYTVNSHVDTCGKKFSDPWVDWLCQITYFYGCEYLKLWFSSASSYLMRRFWFWQCHVCMLESSRAVAHSLCWGQMKLPR